MRSVSNRKLLASFVLLYVGAIGIGLGVAYGGGLFSSQSTPSTSSSTFNLTLVETMNQNYSIPQPKFYVLGSNGLESSASNLNLPLHRMIQLTIVSYDTPTPGSTGDMGKVTGTVGSSVYLANGTIATMGTMPWGTNVTSVPGAVLAHTFSIQQLGINIPVVGGSTIIARLYFDKAGTFTWICLTPCGMGPMGDRGAMSISGWMEGQLTVA